jgi:hypothetical protein
MSRFNSTNGTLQQKIINTNEKKKIENISILEMCDLICFPIQKLGDLVRFF